MGCGLQFDLGKVRDGIFAAARHFVDLIENERIVSRGVGAVDGQYYSDRY
jgi:hypothetical protein